MGVIQRVGLGLANPYSFQHQQRNQVIDDPDYFPMRLRPK